jgi:hypothetical protein
LVTHWHDKLQLGEYLTASRSYVTRRKLPKSIRVDEAERNYLMELIEAGDCSRCKHFEDGIGKTFPLNQMHDISNPEWISGKQDELNLVITEMNGQIAAVSAILTLMAER